MKLLSSIASSLSKLTSSKVKENTIVTELPIYEEIKVTESIEDIIRKLNQGLAELEAEFNQTRP